MFKFAGVLLEKRRFIIAGIVVIVDLWLISLLSPTLQAHQASVTARVNNSANQVPQGTYEGPNVVANAFSSMADDAGRAANNTEVKILNSATSLATGIARFDKDSEHGAYVAATSTIHGIGWGVTFTARSIGGGFAFAGHVAGKVFSFTGRSASGVFKFFSGLTHVGSLIRPQNHTPVPTIVQLRTQQAALIQSGTTGVSVASTTTTGVGGVCDAGNGNGGYPMEWCNAPMDSIATVSYSSDPINRECTSYAYWYFTSVEGNTDFRVRDNAKYWAATSNYPTHAVPAIGAIAVETAGAYGHVAIVQALSGQKYGGQIVPAGYILVSEMNYDWNGHFRYSYSPLNKFSAYIYK